MTSKQNQIYITGGAGYVGAVLVPKLLEKGHKVTVLDLMIYGEEVIPKHPNLTMIKGDIRDQALLKKTIPGHDAVIYASSSSVYGVKEEKNVHEGMSLEPLTDYSKFKADCEKILTRYQTPDFTTVTIRPATVCGYSPRQRLDVVVNILTNLAFHKREISVFGGKQLRPNIHIADMVDAYLVVLKAPKEKIAFQMARINEERAHKLLFTILEQNIRKWWD